MPELAEVEYSRYQFHQYGLNSEIKQVNTKRNDNNEYDTIIYENSENEILETLNSSKFISANRKGKQLYFEIMNGKKKMKYLLIHFGMTGSLVWKDKNIPTYQSFSISKDVWPPKFCKLEIVFKNGNRLAYCDPRRLGRIKLRTNPLNEEPLNKLAPDPSIDGIGNRDDVLKKMNNINTSIKSTLLDQERLYCGLGNWLADEVLYQSCIHPETITKKITGKAFHRLLDTIQSVINIAITCCIEEKSFPQDWLFHYRWDRKITKMPSGETIKILKIGGRTSVYIPSKQKICTESNNNDDEKDEISNSNNKKRKGNEKDIEEKKSKKKKVDK